MNINGKHNSPPSAILRYGVAVLTVSMVLAINLLLESLFAAESPFFLFLTAVIVSTLYGGIWAGFLATILSASICYWLCLSHFGFFFEQNSHHNIKLILLVLEGLFISYIIHKLTIANQKVQGEKQVLQESEKRYLLIEAVQDYAIFLLDPKGVIVSWNQGAQNLKGYEAKEIIGQHFSCFYPKEDVVQGKPDRYLQIAAVEGHIEKEGWRIRKDGSRFWANAIITALRDERGNLTGFCKLTRNLSDRKSEIETPLNNNLKLENQIQERTAQLTAANRELQQQIEERTKAEIALQESEKRFRAIFNQTFQFIGLMQPDGILIEANETALNFGGLRREDAIDRPFWEARWWTLSPETQERLKQAIQKAANGEFIRYEVEVLGAGNTVIAIDFSIKPIHDESGQVVLLIPEGRDITERKQIEAQLHQLNTELEQRVEKRTAQLQREIAQRERAWEELQQTEAALQLTLERFRIALENSPIVVFNQDRELRYTWVYNPQLGYRADEVLGKTDADIMHLDDAARLTEIKQQVLLTGKGVREEVHASKTGEFSYYDLTVEPLRDESNKIIGITAAASNITERKRIEAQLEIRAQQQAAIANLGQRALSGINLDELMKEATNLIAQILKIEYGEILELLPEVHTTSEYTFTQDDIHFLQAVANILAEAIQRQKAREILQQQSEELSLANRLKDEFLATISHELRTPLNSMLGWAKVLPNRNLSQEIVSKAIETIARNTQALAQIIEDVLDMSDIIRGRLNLQVEPVSLQLVIEQAIASLNLAAEAKNILIHSQIDSSVGIVLGDAARLQQIVWNLLSNSVKFTPNGGQIEVRLSSCHNQAQIQVSDTGRGISAEFLPHVFDRFRQEDGSITRSYGGLGLGLAIVRYLVELHGGTIHAQSLGYGKGATFSVLLPLV